MRLNDTTLYGSIEAQDPCDGFDAAEGLRMAYLQLASQDTIPTVGSIQWMPFIMAMLRSLC